MQAASVRRPAPRGGTQVVAQAGPGTGSPALLARNADARTAASTAAASSARDADSSGTAYFHLIGTLPRTGTTMSMKYGTAAIAQMTYGQLHTADPALGASSVVYPGRIIWVVTRYFPHPVTVPYDNGPAGAPATHQISAESFVIDAATGDVTDYCQGCAAVPRPHS